MGTSWFLRTVVLPGFTAIALSAITVFCLTLPFRGQDVTSAKLEADSVRKRIAAAEAELEGRGRLVIRKSGTEPLIRVMAEGDDPALVERLVDDICEAVQSAA